MTRPLTPYEQLALKHCTPKELDAIIMKLAGRSQSEMADALGISISAVKQRIQNAERKIKKAM